MHKDDLGESTLKEYVAGRHGRFRRCEECNMRWKLVEEEWLEQSKPYSSASAPSSGKASKASQAAPKESPGPARTPGLCRRAPEDPHQMQWEFLEEA